MRTDSSAALLLTLAVISFASPPATALAQQRTDPVLVRRVIDGDTIDVAAIGRVQLLGIDAPEIGRNRVAAPPLAREAQQRLAGLLTNRWVRLEYANDKARTRSQSAYVFLEDGKFVNEWMVREGLARVNGRSGLRRLAELQRAEREAQSLRLGIWSNPPSNR